MGGEIKNEADRKEEKEQEQTGHRDHSPCYNRIQHYT